MAVNGELPGQRSEEQIQNRKAGRSERFGGWWKAKYLKLRGLMTDRHTVSLGTQHNLFDAK